MAATLLSPTADEAVHLLDRDGFAIIEHCLSADDAARTRAGLQPIRATGPSGRSDSEGFATRRGYGCFARIRSFDAW